MYFFKLLKSIQQYFNYFITCQIVQDFQQMPVYIDLQNYRKLKIPNLHQIKKQQNLFYVNFIVCSCYSNFRRGKTQEKKNMANYILYEKKQTFLWAQIKLSRNYNHEMMIRGCFIESDSQYFNFLLLIRLSMQQLKELYMFLKSDGQLKEYLQTLSKFVPVFLEKTPEQFAVSEQRNIIQEGLEKLKLEKLESILQKMPPIPHITAYILKASEAYTIAFLMIPSKTVFGWHDHEAMNGVSRCVYGDLTIRSLNPRYLCRQNNTKESNEEETQLNRKMKNGQIMEYPTDRIRQQKLDSKNNRISLIYPDSYNIHEIRSSPHHMSAFIDLLVPEYPDESCHFFETVIPEKQDSEQQEKLRIRKIEEGKNKIIGFDTLIKMIREKSLTTPKNTCPQLIIPPSI